MIDAESGPMEWSHDSWGNSTLEGPIYVLLHGWGRSRADMRPLAERLACESGAYVMSFDIPGFGQSPPPSQIGDSGDYADSLARHLAKQGMGPVIVIGHSLGGRIAIQLAARHKGQVRGVVGLAAAGLKKPRSVIWRARALGMKTLARLARAADRCLGTQFKPLLAAHMGSSDYRAAEKMRPILVRILGEDLSSVAPQVACPALLIYGEHDTETPPEFGQRYARLMPHAMLHILPHLDHLTILSRGLSQTRPLILDFTHRL
ncbi:MAG: alpha/beta hydrolase [Alphaproteobacteria bacterium]|nr:MAG: alpha/beta hydrolase [Alphaproteobacteria bacterium]